MPTSTFQWGALGSYTALITSGQLSGLTTGSLAVSTAAFNNTNGPFYGYLELQVTATGALASGDYMQGWFLIPADGTNYEDSTGASITPARAADFIIPVRAVTNTSQRIVIRNVILPPGNFNTLIQNVMTTKISTGSSVLSLTAYGEQVV